MNEEDRWFRTLDDAIGDSLRPWREGSGSTALLSSGGVDSSLLAWELRSTPRLVLSTVGVRGSADLTAAEEAAGLLGLPWVGTPIAAADVRRVSDTVDPEVAGIAGVRRSVLLAVAVAIDHAPHQEVLCGQGADELFLGYAHYRGLLPAEAGRRAEADLDRLLADDWPRTERIARRLGRGVHAPYLEPKFVTAARSVPLAARLPLPGPKAFFRRWARHRGLPASLADRPKRALQYGSGIDRIVRKGL
jgi:asparagine synthase (glutamine-hydrolysing)